MFPVARTRYPILWGSRDPYFTDLQMTRKPRRETYHQRNRCFPKSSRRPLFGVSVLEIFISKRRWNSDWKDTYAWHPCDISFNPKIKIQDYVHFTSLTWTYFQLHDHCHKTVISSLLPNLSDRHLSVTISRTQWNFLSLLIHILVGTYKFMQKYVPSSNER